MANPEGTDPLDYEGEFVCFDAKSPSGHHRTDVTISLKHPICLYDDAAHSEYRKAKARAAREAKTMLGLHPCCALILEPRDWSNGVDALTAATLDDPESAA